MKLNLKDTRRKLMAARDRLEGKNEPMSRRFGTAIHQAELDNLPGMFATLGSVGQIEQDGREYIHSHHSGRPWAYVPCIGFETHHQ